MSLGQATTEFLSDKGVSKAVVSLASDFGEMFDDILILFNVVAVVIFLWGIWQLISAKKSNNSMGAPSVNGALLKVVFGAMLYTSALWLDEATLSLWANASPAQPMSYVEQAKQSYSSNPFKAALLGIGVFITIIGWVFFNLALYGYATMGEQQDMHGAFWKNTWMAIGGVLLANLALFMTDVSQSFGYTGQLYSGSGF